MIERPILGRLTQGCLFSCAKAQNYDSELVHGFVITARCDVEQDKSPVLNYLPVVPFRSWLEVDGFEILGSRLCADVKGSIKAAMEEAGIPPSLLLTQSAGTIVDSILDTEQDRAVRRAAERFAKQCSALETLQTAIDQGRVSAATLYDYNPKSSSKLVEELIHQKLGGYYFIPKLSPDAADDGHVILLREVKHLEWQLGRAVANGLDETDARIHAGSSELSFGFSSFAEPVGELVSPHVEHVMQCFSILFGRIGLPDTPKSYIDTMCARRPTGQAEAMA